MKNLERFKGIGIALAIVSAIYMCSVVIPIGWATYIITLPALAVIMITSLARVNDLSANLISKTWQLRRIGLILVGTAATTLVLEPWSDILKGIALTKADFPSWKEVILRLGFAFVWITTPHMPPWTQYVWKGKDADKMPHHNHRATDDFDSN